MISPCNSTTIRCHKPSSEILTVFIVVLWNFMNTFLSVRVPTNVEVIQVTQKPIINYLAGAKSRIF